MKLMQMGCRRMVWMVSLVALLSFVGSSMLVQPVQAQGGDHRLFLPKVTASDLAPAQPVDDLLARDAGGDAFLDPDSSFCLDENKIHPVAESVATRYSVPYGTVLDWLCGQGAGFGQTLLALLTAELSAEGVTAAVGPPEFVEDLLEKNRGKKKWGQIWQEQGLIGKPEHAGPPNNKGKPEDVGEPEDEDPPDGLEVPIEEGEETGPPVWHPYCDPLEGTMTLPPAQHPVAQRIAATYADLGVTYEMVIGWFCDGFGFGQILLALETENLTGVPAQELLDRRAQGEGWGRIWQSLDLIGKRGNANP